MRAQSLRLAATALAGAIGALALLVLAASAPVKPDGAPSLGSAAGLALEDAHAILRRRTITPEFDARQGLRVDGRDVSVGGPLTCDAGNAWRIDVSVSQGRAAEEARAAGMCTGTVQEWRGRVAGARPATFEPGAARACARLVATDPEGEVTQRRNWCRNVTLVSEAGVAADDEDDDGEPLTVAALVLAGLALLLGAAAFALARRRT